MRTLRCIKILLNYILVTKALLTLWPTGRTSAMQNAAKVVQTLLIGSALPNIINLKPSCYSFFKHYFPHNNAKYIKIKSKGTTKNNLKKRKIF